MTSIKNVAVFGAAGALGTPILKAIIDSGKFNVTAVTRESSTSTFPASVKVAKADYSSVDSVAAALKGQDAVVSAVGMEGLLGQSVLFDASVAAGVKRFIPSEFGSELSNPLVGNLPVFGYKMATRKHIEEKIASGADITYTYVNNGGFLDWGLDVCFLFNWKEGKPELYNGGDTEFSTTTLASVGQAVVGVLSHYEETKNRVVRVQSRTMTQNKLFALAKKAAPEKKWEPVQASTAAILKSSNESLAKGEITLPVMYGYIFAAIFDEAYGPKFQKIDNELLGINGDDATDAAIESHFKKLLV